MSYIYTVYFDHIYHLSISLTPPRPTYISQIAPNPNSQYSFWCCLFVNENVATHWSVVIQSLPLPTPIKKNPTLPFPETICCQ